MLKEAWKVAIETLSLIEMQKLSEQMAFAKTIEKIQAKNPNSIRLAYSLIIETIRRKNQIDKFINHVLNPENINKLSFDLRSFLRLYIYQTRITKNWSKIYLREAEKIADLGRFIFGWKFFRQIEYILGFLLTQELSLIFEGVDDLEREALQTFHPKWFVKYILDLLGKKQGLNFLQANNDQLPTYLRLNTIKGSESEILNSLHHEGVELKKIKSLKCIYEVLYSKHALTKINSFKKRLFYIQDKASSFAAEIANPKPGNIVLDVCSAPGTKTSYLAQLMKNQGIIYSIDYSKRRTKIWKNEMRQMGVKIAFPIIADVRISLPLDVLADIIVLDPPCTSTGVFSKQPSAKWRITMQSIKKMADIQWQILSKCACKVKSGGTIIYSTCSVTIEENEDIIEKFLKKYSDFFLANIEPKIGLPGLKNFDKCQRFYPNIHRSKGFFVAKLIRQ